METTCPNCGESVRGRFCTSCGTRVDGPAQPAQNVNEGWSRDPDATSMMQPQQMRELLAQQSAEPEQARVAAQTQVMPEVVDAGLDPVPAVTTESATPDDVVSADDEAAFAAAPVSEQAKEHVQGDARPGLLTRLLRMLFPSMGRRDGRA